MGLWAAAEFRCIWVGWLLLIPAGKEKWGSGTVCAQLGEGAELSPSPLPSQAGTRAEGFHHWLALATREGTPGT